MTNEMKLLRAFIEASGYEIEENKTQKSIDDRRKTLAAGAGFDPGYKYDYKVTKKGRPVMNKIEEARAIQIQNQTLSGRSLS